MIQHSIYLHLLARRTWSGNRDIIAEIDEELKKSEYKTVCNSLPLSHIVDSKLTEKNSPMKANNRKFLEENTISDEPSSLIPLNMRLSDTNKNLSSFENHNDKLPFFNSFP